MKVNGALFRQLMLDLAVRSSSAADEPHEVIKRAEAYCSWVLPPAVRSTVPMPWHMQVIDFGPAGDVDETPAPKDLQ